MADNVTTQTATLATIPGSTGIATDQVTYSGDANQHIAPSSLVTISGTEGSKTATQVPAGGGVEAAALRVTIASDSTGVLSVDDNGGSLTVDGTVAISGSVTVAAHDVGSITTAVVPGTAATNLGKAEDAAHASGDVGVMALAVRQASPANLSGAAGDYEPLQVNAGRLWTSATIDAVPAPLSTTGGGTEATALRVTVASDSTGVLSIDDNGGSLTVDGTVAVSGTVTVDSELPTAAALADNASNPTAPAVGAFGMLWDGATWDRRPGNSTDGALVNLGANNDVTVTGTVAVAEVRPASSSVASVAASASSVTLLASNANRKQATIYNDSNVALYAKFGATASTSSFTVKIFGNGYYELPFPVYSGVIDGIWDSASGSARVTELS